MNEYHVHAHVDANGHVGARVLRREEREAALHELLAPGATRPIGAGNRLIQEAPDPLRFCF